MVLFAFSSVALFYYAAWQVAAGNTAIGGVGALRFGKLFGNTWEHTQNPLENQGNSANLSKNLSKV